MLSLLKNKHVLLASLLLFLLSACSSNPKLMPTPNIFINAPYNENNVPVALRKNSMEIIYVTDRGSPNKNNVKYDSSRSASVAYGVAKVNFGSSRLPWSELIAQSSSDNRTADLTYNMQDIEEQGRFPVSPYKFTQVNDKIVINKNVLEQKSLHEKQLSNNINQRLKQSNSKEVILFIHGFNNTFDESVFTLAGIWHFLNRQGVPIVYSWPAAAEGITAYFADKESGQFTIFHLKETLRLLFKNPQIENINIIAHSRGTEVITTALRELIIENRARGGSPRKDFRIKNLVLAAPDLDFGVIKQRLMAEQFGAAFGQVTIYTSQEDNALGISQWLTNSLSFGRLNTTDVNKNEINIFNSVGNVSLIKVPNSNSFIQHDYFHSNPSVSSDLINLILYKARPGSEKRPLKKLENNFWSIDYNYLLEK